MQLDAGSYQYTSGHAQVAILKTNLILVISRSSVENGPTENNVIAQPPLSDSTNHIVTQTQNTVMQISSQVSKDLLQNRQLKQE